MRARMRLELTGRRGDLLAVREARNAVMRGGALLVAALFTGAEESGPISHLGVGTSDAAESDAYDTPALSNADPALEGGTEAPVPPTAFTVVPDPQRRLALVRVRATLPEASALGTIREAGLLSRTGDVTVLYNRVIFAPVTKADDHELTLFWEITFPYGDLHGLA